MNPLLQTNMKDIKTVRNFLAHISHCSILHIQLIRTHILLFLPPLLPSGQEVISPKSTDDSVADFPPALLPLFLLPPLDVPLPPPGAALHPPHLPRPPPLLRLQLPETQDAGLGCYAILRPDNGFTTISG